VSVSIPDACTDFVVTSLDTHAVVQSQSEANGECMRVTWIVRGIKAGTSKRFRLDPTDKPASLGRKCVQLTKGDGTIDVNVNGLLFTRYIYKDAPKPYCYPVIGPTGKPVTRSYPMAEIEGESRDHPHHRSFWFTFGDVNGIDFWSENTAAGKIVTHSLDTVESGGVYGTIRTTNDWIAPDGHKVCEDQRELEIYRVASGQMLDFSVTVKATNGPVTFGDTKEGMLGFRVADSMTVDSKQGHIENSRGDKDKNAWGKQAEWCDFYGPVDGKTVGVAIMDHPTSFRYPTYWHARTYGLFGANPFGLKDFTGDKTKDGSYTIPSGEEITFRYRLLIHRGTAREAGIAQAYDAFVHPPAVSME
jgi:hypothetical protein